MKKHMDAKEDKKMINKAIKADNKKDAKMMKKMSKAKCK